MTETVTVVVPTHDRPDSLTTCVEALLTHTGASVIVVDNHGSATVADHPRVALLREPVTGVTRARNRGLDSAATELVVFVDDDVVVGEGWLDALIAPFADPEVVATVGPISLACRPTRPRWLAPELASWFSALDLGGETRPLTPSEHGWSANLAVRRSAARAIGGFDVTLGPGSSVPYGDDADLLDRLRDAGGRVVYAAPATVRHVVGPERLTLGWLARRCHRQGRTDVALAGRPGRHPLRAARALAGAPRWGLPALVRTARDPGRRPSLVAEQVSIWSAKVGAAMAWCGRGAGPESSA